MSLTFSVLYVALVLFLTSENPKLNPSSIVRSFLFHLFPNGGCNNNKNSFIIFICRLQPMLNWIFFFVHCLPTATLSQFQWLQLVHAPVLHNMAMQNYWRDGAINGKRWHIHCGFGMNCSTSRVGFRRVYELWIQNEVVVCILNACIVRNEVQCLVRIGLDWNAHKRDGLDFRNDNASCEFMS